MNCFQHTLSQWRTPPFWPSELGEFCFCQNADNNTYSCLRTVNGTHNFLYCEFTTGEIGFYDMISDPYQVNSIDILQKILFQLSNIVHELDLSILEQLNEQLRKLKNCVGRKECEHYSSGEWDRPIRRVLRDGVLRIV